MSITPPDRSRSPSPQEDFHDQQPGASSPQVQATGQQAQQPRPMGGAAEALVMQPLSFWAVLKLPERAIQHLHEEQIAGAAKYIKQYSGALFQEIRDHPERLARDLDVKLLAFGSNPYVKQDERLVETLAMASSYVTTETTNYIMDRNIERAEKLHQEFVREREEFEERQARFSEQQAIDDRAFQEEHRLQQERQRRGDEEQRLLFAQQDELLAQIARRDAESEAARERARQDAAQRADEIPPHEYEPQPPDSDDWTGFFKVSAIIACLAIAYGWFRGKGDSPKVE